MSRTHRPGAWSLALTLALMAAPAHARTWHVAPGAGQEGDGRPGHPLGSIQQALGRAGPGERVALAAGDYREDLVSVRDGAPDRPIVLEGPRTAVIRGSGRSARVILIRHDHLILRGFTVDGLDGDPRLRGSWRNKLVYLAGEQPGDPVVGVKLLRLHLRNAGGECLRIRYHARDIEVAESVIERCGAYDFHLGGQGSGAHARLETGSLPSEGAPARARPGGSGRNGEGIYVGTSSRQWDDGRNPTGGPDATHAVHIHNNRIDTGAAECIDIKEGAHDNLVEHNECHGQADPNSGGISVRGDANTVRHNLVVAPAGAGVRVGGNEVDGRRYGVGNTVRDNRVEGAGARAFKILVRPQALVCGNLAVGSPGGDITTQEYMLPCP
ncbi:MAG: hypothetical protein HY778_13890 [Betaproteobacteria bacterium]|nr:hypothetical protein [Betaproteobacteria bacterium]